MARRDPRQGAFWLDESALELLERERKAMAAQIREASALVEFHRRPLIPVWQQESPLKAQLPPTYDRVFVGEIPVGRPWDAGDGGRCMPGGAGAPRRAEVFRELVEISERWKAEKKAYRAARDWLVECEKAIKHINRAIEAQAERAERRAREGHL